MVEIVVIERGGWVTFSANFREKGHLPPTIFGIRKRVAGLSYGEKKIAENFNLLSRVHQRYRQTTDGRAIAYSERERKYHDR